MGRPVRILLRLCLAWSSASCAISSHVSQYLGLPGHSLGIYIHVSDEMKHEKSNKKKRGVIYGIHLQLILAPREHILHKPKVTFFSFLVCKSVISTRLCVYTFKRERYREREIEIIHRKVQHL